MKLNDQLRAIASRNLVGRLATDRRGNVLFIAAAAILPLIGLVGSSVDMGRAYMAKLRLQQACDSGVLAGRRAMGHGGFTPAAQEKAHQMFDFNFPDRVYGTRSVDFIPVSANSTDVTAIATAVLPTSIMFVFGFDQFDLRVDCGAKLEIANTDIMMVLDVTGSMDSGGKLASLKSASNLFLTTLMSADAGGSRIRIGIVPYALTVNVGKILYDKNPNWIDNQVELPSLAFVKSSGQITKSSFSRNVCNNKGQSCQNRNVTFSYHDDTYRFQNVTYDVTGLKSGLSASMPIGERGVGKNIIWDGCITEVNTTATPAGGSFNLSSALDMNINHVPDGTSGAKWKMYLPQMAYERDGQATKDVTVKYVVSVGSNYTDNPKNSDLFANSFESYAAAGGHESGCPVAAMKLTTMDATGQTAYTNKIASLSAKGYTYHDVGIAWGARLISPKGIFRSENETADNGKPISRHIVFMTDGKMDTSWDRYAHQGVEKIIPRVGTTKVVTTSKKGSTTTTYETDPQHINRFVQLCNYTRGEGVKIWVVAFGFGNVEDLEDDPAYQTLVQCADPGQMYSPNDGAALAQVFASIAGQIARLRVSQ